MEVPVQLMLLLGLSFAANHAMAACDHLVGTWHFVSERDTRADGTVVKIDTPAEGYSGTLIYTADGHVSALLMPKNRVWKGSDPSDEELRSTVMAPATTAYSGTYTIDHVHNTVTHHVQISIDPNYERKDLVRKCKTGDTRLELSGEWTQDGVKLIFTIVWKKS